MLYFLARKIQKISLYIIVSWMLIQAQVVFAQDFTDHNVPSKAFFAVHKKLPWHLGMKGWFRLDVMDLPQSFGFQATVGPFVEWRFLNGLGIQTGLCYGFHQLLFSLSCTLNNQAMKPTDFVKKIVRESSKLNVTHPSIRDCKVVINMTALHVISMPFIFRFYPEKTGQLVIYLGPRFAKIIAGKKQVELLGLHLSSGMLHDLIQKGWKPGFKDILSLAKPVAPDNQQLSAQEKQFRIYWDVGFEFNGKSGFIMGINQIGLVFGYDVARWFLKK